LARIQAIIRDKTGTLTVGALAVNDSLNFAPGGRLAAASPSPEGGVRTAVDGLGALIGTRTCWRGTATGKVRHSARVAALWAQGKSALAAALDGQVAGVNAEADCVSASSGADIATL
jgi:cation transport ATPase